MKDGQIDFNVAKQILKDAGINIKCPMDGEVAATKAESEGKWELAAAAWLMGSAHCLGHGRGDDYEYRSICAWSKVNKVNSK